MVSPVGLVSLVGLGGSLLGLHEAISSRTSLMDPDAEGVGKELRAYAEDLAKHRATLLSTLELKVLNINDVSGFRSNTPRADNDDKLTYIANDLFGAGTETNKFVDYLKKTKIATNKERVTVTDTDDSDIIAYDKKERSLKRPDGTVENLSDVFVRLHSTRSFVDSEEYLRDRLNFYNAIKNDKTIDRNIRQQYKLTDYQAGTAAHLLEQGRNYLLAVTSIDKFNLIEGFVGVANSLGYIHDEQKMAQRMITEFKVIHNTNAGDKPLFSGLIPKDKESRKILVAQFEKKYPGSGKKILRELQEISDDEIVNYFTEARPSTMRSWGNIVTALYFNSLNGESETGQQLNIFGKMAEKLVKREMYSLYEALKTNAEIPVAVAEPAQNGSGPVPKVSFMRARDYLNDPEVKLAFKERMGYEISYNGDEHDPYRGLTRKDLFMVVNKSITQRVAESLTGTRHFKRSFQKVFNLLEMESAHEINVPEFMKKLPKENTTERGRVQKLVGADDNSFPAPSMDYAHTVCGYIAMKLGIFNTDVVEHLRRCMNVDNESNLTYQGSLGKPKSLNNGPEDNPDLKFEGDFKTAFLKILAHKALTPDEPGSMDPEKLLKDGKQLLKNNPALRKIVNASTKATTGAFGGVFSKGMGWAAKELAVAVVTPAFLLYNAGVWATEKAKGLPTGAYGRAPTNLVGKIFWGATTAMYLTMGSGKEFISEKLWPDYKINDNPIEVIHNLQEKPISKIIMLNSANFKDQEIPPINLPEDKSVVVSRNGGEAAILTAKDGSVKIDGIGEGSAAYLYQDADGQMKVAYINIKGNSATLSSSPKSEKGRFSGEVQYKIQDRNLDEILENHDVKGDQQSTVKKFVDLIEQRVDSISKVPGK